MAGKKHGGGTEGCRDGILIIGGREVEGLAGREQEIADIVARAYVAHNRGRSPFPIRCFCDSRTTNSTASSPYRRFWATGSRSRDSSGSRPSRGTCGAAWPALRPS